MTMTKMHLNFETLKLFALQNFSINKNKKRLAFSARFGGKYSYLLLGKGRYSCLLVQGLPFGLTLQQSVVLLATLL